MLFLAKTYVFAKRPGTFPGCSPYFFEPPGGPGAAGGRQNHVFLHFFGNIFKKTALYIGVDTEHQSEHTQMLWNGLQNEAA